MVTVLKNIFLSFFSAKPMRRVKRDLLSPFLPQKALAFHSAGFQRGAIPFDGGIRGQSPLILRRIIRELARIFLLCIFCCGISCAEEPFGKDASLVKWKERVRIYDGTHPGFIFIRFHQQYSTHIDAPRSHFIPSSSEYMRQAMSFYGAGVGFLYGCERLLRENGEEWLYPQIRTSDGLVKSNPVPRPRL